MNNSITKRAWMLAVITVSFFIHLGLNAQVQYDSSSSKVNSSASVSKLSWNHSVGAGSDRLLVVGVTVAGGVGVDSVTYAGTRLTRLAGKIFNTNVELWYLINPPSGTAGVLVQNKSGDRFIAGAVSFSNVDQQSPFSNVDSASANGKNPTVKIPSAVGEMVMDVVGVSAASPTINVNPSQTERWNATASIGGAGSTKAGADTITMTCSYSVNRDWAMLAASIRPANTAGIQDKNNARLHRSSLYPNPMDEMAVLEVWNSAGTKTDFLEIRFRNLTGAQVVFSMHSEIASDSFRYFLNRGDLPAGIYFYEVFSSGIRISEGEMVLR